MPPAWIAAFTAIASGWPRIAKRVRSAIATRTAGVLRMPEIEIDAGVIGAGLGIEPAQVQAHLQERRIRVLCERGTGEDGGTFRVSFYLGSRSLRVLVDAAGTLLHREVRDAGVAQPSHCNSQPDG